MQIAAEFRLLPGIQEKVELLFRAFFSMSTAPGRVLDAVDVLKNEQLPHKVDLGLFQPNGYPSPPNRPSARRRHRP